jgi:hypothetical protein
MLGDWTLLGACSSEYGARSLPHLCARGVAVGLTNTLGVGSRPISCAIFLASYACSAAVFRSSSNCFSFSFSAFGLPAFRFPNTLPKTEAKAREKRPNVPSLAVGVTGGPVIAEPTMADDVVDLWEPLRMGGALLSSLNLSIMSSIAISFHSSSGGGFIELAVLVCSLNREARGCAGVSSLIADAPSVPKPVIGNMESVPKIERARFPI